MENPDIIMLLGEIQKIAVISAETRTSVNLLRAEVSEIKKDSASCSDVERIEKAHEEHLGNHEKIQKEATEAKRWSIGTFIAAAGLVVTAFFGWWSK